MESWWKDVAYSHDTTVGPVHFKNVRVAAPGLGYHCDGVFGDVDAASTPPVGPENNEYNIGYFFSVRIPNTMHRHQTINDLISDCTKDSSSPPEEVCDLVTKLDTLLMKKYKIKDAVPSNIESASTGKADCQGSGDGCKTNSECCSNRCSKTHSCE